MKKKTQGHTDILLNENGRMQARELANKIQNLKVDKIISSDLLRAKETAEIINEKFNKEIILDKRLREFYYGNLEGVPRDTLTPDIWDIFNYYPEKLNAEPKTQIFNRIKSFFDEIKKSDDIFLIVTHSGALRMIMYYLYNNNEFNNDEYLARFNNYKINNADIFEVNVQNNTIKIYKKEE